MWVWVVDSSPALVVGSQSFGSGWISKKTLPRAEQGQPAAKLAGFLQPWCSSLSTGCRAGWGKLCSPSQTSVGLSGLPSFRYFPPGEEECSAAGESSG